MANGAAKAEEKRELTESELRAVARADFLLANSEKHSKVQQRMAAVESKKPLADHCKFDKYRRLEHCACKMCGSMISGMQPHDNLREVVRDGNKVVVYERVSMARLANYAELRIRFDDESAHDTGICITCKQEVLAMPKDKMIEALEWMYACDMRAMTMEQGVNAANINWKPWADRVPVSAE